MKWNRKWLAALAPAIFLSAAFAEDIRVPLGLLPIQWPADNPYSKAKSELGKLLYFDKRLSADASLSCASCHHPKFAFADGAALSTGIRGQKGGRSAPTVLNRAYSLAQFWDGRAATLEEQAKGPMQNPIEMGHTHEGLVGKLREIPGYRAQFKAVYGVDEMSIDQVAKAIATFERTVLSGNSPYDQYKSGKRKAMTSEQVAGMNLFFGKAKCDSCHEGINFTSNAYHNLGIGMDKPDPDPGRFVVTKNPADLGAFKTPTLREVAKTGPYMHDGRFRTLEEVVEFYDEGGIANPNLDKTIKPLKLTPAEEKALIAFMHALSGEGWQDIQEPTVFPQ